MTATAARTAEHDDDVAVVRPPRRGWPEPLLPWAIAFTLGAAWSALALVRWGVTESRSVDLGYFDQAQWLLTHGEPLFVTTRGLSLFADHFSLTFVPIALVAWVIPGRHGLVVVQAFALAITVVPVWFIARRHGRVAIAPTCVLVAAVACYPTLWNQVLDGFHTEAVTIPVIAAALLFALDRRFAAYWVCIAWILATREDFGLLVFGIGITVFVLGHRRIALVTSAAGLAWFVIATGVVMPALNGGTLSQGGRYSQWGDTTGEVISFVARHPWHLVTDLFARDTGTLLLALLVPLAFTPLLGWRLLLAIVPFEWALLLTDVSLARDVRYHYTAAATGVLVAAAAIGAAPLLRGRNRKPFAVVLLAAALVGYALWSATGLAVADATWRNDAALERARRDAIAMVPPSAPVAVTAELADGFSQRRDVYNFPQPWDYWTEPANSDTTAAERAARIDWVVVDTRAAWVWPGSRDRWIGEKLPALGFEKVYDEAGVLVFHRPP